MQDMNQEELNRVPFAKDTFMTTPNMLGYFLFRDSLHHMGELAFSSMRTYYCGAGCKMCYLKDSWLPREEMIARNEGLIISPYIEHKFLKLFEIFGKVESLDDLRFIKNKHPNLFQFYKKYGKHIGAPSFTDNAILQQYRIILDDLDMKHVYQITLSEEFIGKRADKLAEVLELIVQKYGVIPVFKIIIDTRDSMTSNPNIQRFIDKVRHLVTHIEVQQNIDAGDRDMTIVDMTNQQVAWDDTYYYEYGEAGRSNVFRVLQNFIFLIHDRMYYTFEDSIDADTSKSSYNLLMEEPTAANLLSKTLESKIAAYNRYASQIQKRENNRYFDYFNAVGKSFKVNHDFNFIPAPVLEPRFHIVSQLEKEGFVMLKEGYLRNDGNPPKSIIEAIQ